MKTARFSQLVDAAGKPEPYVLWVEPKQDKQFQSALKANRVLTVHQEHVGAKKDYGEVGYDGDRGAQILIFPKSIRRFAGRQVIGIKYDLVEEPEAAPPRKEKEKTPPKPQKAKEVKPTFRVLPDPKPLVKTAEKKPTEDKPAEKKPTKKEPAEKRAAPAKEKTRSRSGKAAAPAKPPRDEKPPVPAAAKPTVDADKLLAGIRAALIALEQGNQVAAYKKLEALLPKSDR